MHAHTHTSTAVFSLSLSHNVHTHTHAYTKNELGQICSVLIIAAEKQSHINWTWPLEGGMRDGKFCKTLGIVGIFKMHEWAPLVCFLAGLF